MKAIMCRLSGLLSALLCLLMFAPQSFAKGEPSGAAVSAAGRYGPDLFFPGLDKERAKEDGAQDVDAETMTRKIHWLGLPWTVLLSFGPEGIIKNSILYTDLSNTATTAVFTDMERRGMRALQAGIKEQRFDFVSLAAGGDERELNKALDGVLHAFLNEKTAKVAIVYCGEDLFNELVRRKKQHDETDAAEKDDAFQGYAGTPVYTVQSDLESNKLIVLSTTAGNF